MTVEVYISIGNQTLHLTTSGQARFQDWPVACFPCLARSNLSHAARLEPAHGQHPPLLPPSNGSTITVSGKISIALNISEAKAPTMVFVTGSAGGRYERPSTLLTATIQ